MTTLYLNKVNFGTSIGLLYDLVKDQDKTYILTIGSPIVSKKKSLKKDILLDDKKNPVVFSGSMSECISDLQSKMNK